MNRERHETGRRRTRANALFAKMFAGLVASLAETPCRGCGAIGLPHVFDCPVFAARRGR